MTATIIETTTYPGDYSSHRFQIGDRQYGVTQYTRFNESRVYEFRRMKTGNLKAFAVKVPAKRSAILTALLEALADKRTAEIGDSLTAFFAAINMEFK